jgi:3-oxoacyl-[acyl-carrier protein] reductase
MNTKVAVITGASQGIGRAEALALAKDGMYIVINYLHSAKEAEELVQDIEQFSRAKAIRADVTDPVQVQNTVEETLNIFGHIDVLVNNAGAIPRPGDWQNITEEVWQQTLDINLRGTFNCIRYFSPIFQRQQSGKIINTTSTYGIIGATPVVAYTAAKAGVIDLTRGFAKELAPYVTVNAVAPGNIDTEMTRGAGEEFVHATIESTPLKRLGTVEDVANVVSFLASSRADFITGQVIVVDGGHMLR